MPRSKPLSIALHVAWLLIVAVAVVLALRDYRDRPLILIPVLALAAIMRVLFVISLLPHAAAPATAGPLVKSLGRWFTGALILAAVLVLVTTVVTGYRNLGVTGIVIIGFFAFVFTRIFIDFLRDARRPERKAARKRRLYSSGKSSKSKGSGFDTIDLAGPRVFSSCK